MDPRSRASAKSRQILGGAIDTTLRHRRATVRYASASSRRGREHQVEGQRIVYTAGGVYLIAWVPACGEMRTFAVERIETFAIMDDSFEPRLLPIEPFGDSMGVNTGTPERIVEFEAEAGSHARTRLRHKSQQMDQLPNGRLRVTQNASRSRTCSVDWLGRPAASERVSPDGRPRWLHR